MSTHLLPALFFPASVPILSLRPEKQKTPWNLWLCSTYTWPKRGTYQRGLLPKFTYERFRCMWNTSVFSMLEWMSVQHLIWELPKFTKRNTPLKITWNIIMEVWKIIIWGARQWDPCHHWESNSPLDYPSLGSREMLHLWHTMEVGQSRFSLKICSFRPLTQVRNAVNGNHSQISVSRGLRFKLRPLTGDDAAAFVRVVQRYSYLFLQKLSIVM